MIRFLLIAAMLFALHTPPPADAFCGVLAGVRARAGARMEARQNARAARRGQYGGYTVQYSYGAGVCAACMQPLQYGQHNHYQAPAQVPQPQKPTPPVEQPTAVEVPNRFTVIERYWNGSEFATATYLADGAPSAPRYGGEMECKAYNAADKLLAKFEAGGYQLGKR